MLNYGESALGLPTSDEREAIQSGTEGFDTTGVVCDFEGGHIYWHRVGKYKDKAFETHGAIDGVYQKEGASGGWLGFPISNEYKDSKTGYARSDFEGGYITTSNGIDYHAYPYTPTPSPNVHDIAVEHSEIPVLNWPLTGEIEDRRILLGFGDIWTWTYCGGLPKKHTGVDLKASVGEDVYAAYDGVVKAVYALSSKHNWGKGVVIEHSGFTTTYMHVNPVVIVGAHVNNGQKISTIINIDGDEHLHFGVRNSAYSDVSKRGALPQKQGDSNYDKEGHFTGCKNDPLFPEKFVDPMKLKYEIASTITNKQKQEEILTMVNNHRGSIPPELVLAIIRQEGGGGAFYVNSWEKDNNYEDHGAWSQPKNGDGIMQVTSGSGHHHAYAHTREGYDLSIKDGCDYLLENYNTYDTYVQAVLHYNAGPNSLYTYLDKNEGDREYLSHVAMQLTNFVPNIYSVQNQNLVSALNRGQNILNDYLNDKEIKTGQTLGYYKHWQRLLERDLHGLTFKTNDHVKVIAENGWNMRSGPKLGDQYIKIPPSPLPKGSEGEILEHENNGIFADGHYWWYVKFKDYEGWCAEKGLGESETFNEYDHDRDGIVKGDVDDLRMQYQAYYGFLTGEEYDHDKDGIIRGDADDLRMQYYKYQGF